MSNEGSKSNEGIVAGNKYHRTIHNLPWIDGAPNSCTVDVYCITDACDVTCIPTAHAIKKLLFAGLRDKGSRLQDLEEAEEALIRAIQIARREYEEEKTRNQASQPAEEVDDRSACEPKSRQTPPEYIEFRGGEPRPGWDTQTR